MKRVIIPTVNWYIALSDAVKEADAETVLVVDTKTKAGLVWIASERSGKTVNVVIEYK